MDMIDFGTLVTRYVTNYCAHEQIMQHFRQENPID
jgi:hypothetical protein